MSEQSSLATADAPEVLPTATPDDVIEKTAVQLQRTWREGALETATRMGEIIVTNLYGGDVAAWRSRGAKDSSFRKLSQRLSSDDGSQLSASFLSRACGLYELEQRLAVSALEHITATHAYAVLGLADDDQERLLKLADSEGWSSRQLEEEARRLRPQDRRGRKPLPTFQKGLGKLLKAIDEAASEPIPEDVFTAYGGYGPEDARRVLTRLETELARLQGLREQIEERIRAAEEVD